MVVYVVFVCTPSVGGELGVCTVVCVAGVVFVSGLDRHLLKNGCFTCEWCKIDKYIAL